MAIFLSVLFIYFSSLDLTFVVLLSVCLPCLLLGLSEDLGFSTPPVARLIVTLVSAIGLLITQGLWLP